MKHLAFTLLTTASIANFATDAFAQPAVFNPATENSCVLSWFGLSTTDTVADLSKAYNETAPMRLAALLNICGAIAGSTAKPCDEMCAVEIQVGAEMRSRKSSQTPLKDIERLR